MSLPSRIAAYADCYAIYDSADPHGTRCLFATYGEANYFMMRMHQARSLIRDQARLLYPPSDKRYGQSEFDKFTVRKPIESSDDPGKFWVYIEPNGSNVIAIETLGPNETLRELMHANTGEPLDDEPDNEALPLAQISGPGPGGLS